MSYGDLRYDVDYHSYGNSPGTENIDWGFRVLLDGDVRYINTLVINSYGKNSPDTSDSYYAWYVGPDGAVSIFNYHVGDSYGHSSPYTFYVNNGVWFVRSDGLVYGNDDVYNSYGALRERMVAIVYI